MTGSFNASFIEDMRKEIQGRLRRTHNCNFHVLVDFEVWSDIMMPVTGHFDRYMGIRLEPRELPVAYMLADGK